MSYVTHLIANAPQPRVHLNGTSAAELKREAQDVLVAISNLRIAIADATTHPRDFVTYADGVTHYEKARSGIELQREVLDALDTYYTTRLRVAMGEN